MAAPQVGYEIQSFTLVNPKMWCGLIPYKQFITFVNPAIFEESLETRLHWEGCASFPL